MSVSLDPFDPLGLIREAPISIALIGTSLRTEHFAKRQEIATGLVEVLADCRGRHCAENIQEEFAEKLFGDLVTIYTDLLTRYPNLPPVAEGLQEFRSEFEARIKATLETDEFKKALEMSFASMVPSHPNSRVLSPFAMMLQWFENMPQEIKENGSIREFAIGIIKDVNDIDVAFRQLLQYQQCVYESVVDYLVDNKLEASHANVFAAFRQQFDTKAELDRHYQLVEKTSLMASKKMIDALVGRISALVNNLEDTEPEMMDITTKIQPSIDTGSVVAEHLHKFASTVINRTHELFKNSNRAFSSLVFAEN